MDKKVFLLDKEVYDEDMVKNLTEKDLEKWVAEESYTENFTIMKIDANDYPTPEEAIKGEGILSPEEYYIRTFGFKTELYTLWMRLGIDLIGTEEELQKVKKGDEETLVRLLKAKSFEIWGDSYVPNNDEQVVGFELPTIKFE